MTRVKRGPQIIANLFSTQKKSNVNVHSCSFTAHDFFNVKETRAAGTHPKLMVARSCAVDATWRTRLKIVPKIRLLKKRFDPTGQGKTLSLIIIIIIIIVIIINDNVYGAILMTMVTARVYPVNLMNAD